MAGTRICTILTLYRHELVRVLSFQVTAKASTILGPVLFNIFINHLDAGLEGILRGEAVDFLKGREVQQKDLDKLEG